MNPQSVRGSRTGVFIGCHASEAFTAWTADAERATGHAFVGCGLNMFADMLSAFFDFKGMQRLMPTSYSYDPVLKTWFCECSPETTSVQCFS